MIILTINNYTNSNISSNDNDNDHTNKPNIISYSNNCNVCKLMMYGCVMVVM